MIGKKCVPLLCIVAAVAVLGVASGCGKRQENKTVVSIQKTTLSVDAPLVAGETVTFQIDVRVQGLESSGQLGLIVQSAERVIVATCDPIAVTDGATVRLTAVGLVPETTVIRVFTPLYVNGNDKTEVLDTRLFQVIGKRSKG